MKITLSVLIKNPDGFKEVEAEFLFDLAPHLADVATFALHPDPSFKYRWNVTNVETGLWVSQGFTRAQAIRNASSILKDKTPEIFGKAYENAPKMYPQIASELS